MRQVGDRRDSGIARIGEVPWGTHFCQFYQTQQDLLDILVPYFKARLESVVKNHEFALAMTDRVWQVIHNPAQTQMHNCAAPLPV